MFFAGHQMQHGWFLRPLTRFSRRGICVAQAGPLADFFRRMERLAFGRDFECVDDCNVHVHGPNSISSGRGTFLIVDLTNRCNMMCSPCFMDANASSYVHELSIEDIKTIFNNALSFKPQREINILFSGGEPTVSPIFLDAVRHAKGMGV